MHVKFPTAVDNSLRFLKLKLLPKTLFFRTMLLIFIPLIVVNCIILGRAEAFASKNGIWQSILDAVGMGIGFTGALTLLGIVREILGTGSVFGWKFVAEDFDTMMLFIMPPGAFLALAGLIIVFNKITGACK